MKRIAIFIIVCATFAVVTGTVSAQNERTRVPRVDYLEPDNDTTVDLTGKTSLVFRWNGSPIPAGGREAYRFRLFKGFTYDAIVAEDLKPNVYFIEVPADKFDDGSTYSWHVNQRDSSNMSWGLFNTWSFKVLKKK